MQVSDEIKSKFEAGEEVLWSQPCQFSLKTKVLALSICSGILLVIAAVEPALRIVWLVGGLICVPILLYLLFRHAERDSFILTNARLLKLHDGEVIGEYLIPEMNRVEDRKGINGKVIVHAKGGKVKIESVVDRDQCVQLLTGLLDKKSE